MMINNIIEEELKFVLNEINEKSLIIEFIDDIEHYQSNHYGSYNRDYLVNSYHELPDNIKKIIKPSNTNNLYRGADGLSYKSAISFTDNKEYAKIFGYYLISFSALKKYDGLISTSKLVEFLDENEFEHDIGDDEGEVIVINPTYKSEIFDNFESYRHHF